MHVFWFITEILQDLCKILVQQRRIAKTRRPFVCNILVHEGQIARPSGSCVKFNLSKDSLQL